jgi:hypothetical protein
MRYHVFPHQVLAKDIIKTHNGKEVVYSVDIYKDFTVVINFEFGNNIICYTNEVLEVDSFYNSFRNLIYHNTKFKN